MSNNNFLTFRYKPFVFAALLCLAVTGLQSCFDDEYDLDKMSGQMEYSPEVAISIGSLNFGLNSLLERFDSTTKPLVRPDGMLYIVYEQDLQSFRGGDVITLQAQQNVKIPSLVLPPKFDADGVSQTSIPLDIPFDFAGDQSINFLVLKTLSIQIAGSSTYNVDKQQIILTFLDTKKVNLNPDLQEVAGAPVFGDTLTMTTQNFDIESSQDKARGYKLTFANVSAGSSVIKAQLTYKIFGTPNTFVPVGLLDGVIKLNNLKYLVMNGYVGQYELMNATDTMDLSMLNRSMASNIHWAEPRIEIRMKNSFGMPVTLDIKEITVTSEINNAIYPATPTNNKKLLATPTKPFLEENDTFAFKRPESDAMLNAIEKAPSQMVYHIVAQSNAAGKTGSNNILLDTSTIQSKLHFELPFYFSSTGFGTTDTMDNPLASSSGGTTYDDLAFNIASKNDMPIDMLLQCYFTDENFVVLDSLFIEGGNEATKIISAGKLDLNGNVIPATDFKKTVIGLNNKTARSKLQLDNVAKSKKMLLKITMATGNDGQPVKFKKDNKLAINLSFKAKPRFKF